MMQASQPDSEKPSSKQELSGEAISLEVNEALQTFALNFPSINWTVFYDSFDKLKVDYTELSIQGTENKFNGAAVIQVEVPENADAQEISNSLIQEYLGKLEAVNQQKNHLHEVTKPMSESPKKVSEFNLQNAQFGGGFVNAHTVEAQQIGGNINNYGVDKQESLAEVVIEMQQLLEQLAQDYPKTAEDKRQDIVKGAIEKKAQDSPTFKKRFLSAAKAGSIELVKVLTNNPFVSVPIEIVKGWFECE